MLFILWNSSFAQKLSDRVLEWPSAPQKARIQFLYSIAGKEDFGIKKSWWQKVTDFIFGEEKENSAMRHPQAIAVDKEGILYVTDTEKKLIHVINVTQKEYYEISGPKEYPLISPVGIAIANDLIYVSDSERKSIFVFDLKGTLKTRLSIKLNRPCGLCIKNGLLYIVDTGENQIVVADLDGKEIRRFGERGIDKVKFNYPLYITTNSQISKTSLFVVDALNFRVQTLNTNGTFISAFGKLGDGIGNFARPKGIALDSDDNMYVVDALFDVVQIFNTQGQILMAFGGSGSQFGKFCLPSCIVIDERNKIYVVDSGNKRVQVFQYLQ